MINFLTWKITKLSTWKISTLVYFGFSFVVCGFGSFSADNKEKQINQGINTELLVSPVNQGVALLIKLPPKISFWF